MIRSRSNVGVLVASCGLALCLAGCGFYQSEPVGSDGAESAEPERSSTTENPTTALNPPTTEAPTTTEAPATTEAPTTAAGQVVEPGDLGQFTSPSGNIACYITVERGASCWISEKQWEIEQPTDDPDCAIFDWGNAIDVSADGISWPCYSDMSWPIGADPLPYGDRMKVGQFECASATTGVTCLNADGQGFRLARAEVALF